MSISKKIQGFWSLSRPFEWSKTLGGMVFGSFLAIYFLNSFFALNQFDLVLFAIAFLSAGIFLWSGLYALNDLTDYKKDKLHKVKKFRPIPSGKILPWEALVFAIALILVSLIIAWNINSFFFACIIGMILNALLYSFEPIKLKTKPVLDLISGSLVNPFFRFYAGWVLFIPAFNAPLLFLIFVLGIQFGGYTLYRFSGKKLEKKLDFKSSVVLFKEKTIKNVSYLAMLLGMLAFVFLPLTKFFELEFLGTLPLRFLALIVLAIIFAPFYIQTLKNPKQMDIKKMYNLVYFHFLIFILGFIALFVFF